MAVTPQKQTARNLVLSANSQAAYGGVLADANLTYRASVDPSTVFSNPDQRYTDQNAIGHGTDFATASVRTAWDSMATVKGMGGVDAWLLGWMLALTFGQESVTGAGPYTHAFTIPFITAQMPCTTAYVEDTDDVHRKYADMAAKMLSLDIPERGPINATLDMVGTGKFYPGSFGTALPNIVSPTYLLGSDMRVSLTPQGGGLVSMIGRTAGISAKFDRGSSAFKSNGDGLTAGSVNAGKLAYSADMTILANETDDVNGYYENDTPVALSLFTNPGLAYQLQINFPVAKIKANKLGNKDDMVAWGLSFDQTTAIQVGAAPAFSVTLINGCPGYLIPA